MYNMLEMLTKMSGPQGGTRPYQNNNVPDAIKIYHPQSQTRQEYKQNLIVLAFLTIYQVTIRILISANLSIRNYWMTIVYSSI